MSLAPITKDMLDVLTDIQVEEEIHKLPPCEGESHPQGLYGHDPSQPAAYLVGPPCGLTLLMCAGWVEQPVSEDYYGQTLECLCGDWHDWEDISFIPLTEVSS